ncbi:MAG TPA: hypothetical protein VGR20_11975 [Acidimicrobiia bacterium]|nr:hypothetical protein [Acidimicrobiia bacterium]
MTAESRLASLVALVVGGLGGIAVLAAWAGSASTPLVGRQATWGALGVAGAIAVTAASLLWVATGRQAVARRTTELRAAVLAGAMESRFGATGAGAATDQAPGPADELVSGPAMVHYHRAGCRLAAGKPVGAAARADHERAGRTPCGICLGGTPPDPRRGP